MDIDFRLDPVNNDADFNLLAFIQQVGHASYMARGRELRKFGLTNMWAATLYVVFAMDNNATQSDISRWLLRELHTITGLLDRMEREGLIHRHHDWKRKNVVRVAMTEKGREAYLQSIRRDTYHRIAAAIDDTEREVLQRALVKLWKASLQELSKDGNWASRAASHLIEAELAGQDETGTKMHTEPSSRGSPSNSEQEVRTHTGAAQATQRRTLSYNSLRAL